MLEANTDAGANKREAGAHDAGQSNADGTDTLALDDRDDAGAKQRGIHKRDDLIWGKFERAAQNERYGDDAAKRGEQMLCGKQHGRQDRWTILDLIKQRLHASGSPRLIRS